MKVSCVMTVRGEPADRIDRRIMALEEAAAVGLVDEFVISAPLSEHRLLRSCAERNARVLEVRLVANPTGERSPGLNAAVREARSPTIIRVDARSAVGKAHLALYRSVLEEEATIGVTGGRQIPVSGSDRLIPRAIARALGNPWALGGARYRQRGASGEADTVYLGAYRRDELLAMGGWDERLGANEDYDLCQRYAVAGLQVWLAPIDVDYEVRTTVHGIWGQYRAFGRAKVYYWRLRSGGPQARQLLALVAAGAAVLTAPWLLARRQRAVTTAIGAVTGLIALDRADAQGDDAIVRALAMPLYPIIWLAWATGVVEGLVRR